MAPPIRRNWMDVVILAFSIRDFERITGRVKGLVERKIPTPVLRATLPEEGMLRAVGCLTMAKDYEWKKRRPKT